MDNYYSIHKHKNYEYRAHFPEPDVGYGKMFTDAYAFNSPNSKYLNYQAVWRKFVELLLSEILFLAMFYFSPRSRRLSKTAKSDAAHPKEIKTKWQSITEPEITSLKSGKPEANVHQENISKNELVANARNNVGKAVWAFTPFANLCQHGNLGCAATVGDLLQQTGLRIAGSASVIGLVDQLAKKGWQRVKINSKEQFREGDVVYGVNGSHAHIGIISEVKSGKVLVCDNSSSSGTLKERTIERGGSFIPNGRFAGHLYVMRPSRTA